MRRAASLRPISVETDPYWSDVLLLQNFDEPWPDYPTTAIPSEGPIPATMTAQWAPPVLSGDGALLFPYLTLGPPPINQSNFLFCTSFDLSAGTPWTVECDVTPQPFTQSPLGLFHVGYGFGLSQHYELFVDHTTNKLNFRARGASGGSQTVEHTASVTAGIRYFISASIVGSTLHLAVDGTSEQFTLIRFPDFSAQAPQVHVGSCTYGQNARYTFVGSMHRVRLTAASRYSGSYTTLTDPFPTQ
jgi:hypothetical protein